MRHVATGQITLLDSNDYLSTGLTAPSNPVAGVTLWVDTSVTPNQLKKWSGTVWEIVSDAQAAIEKAKQDAINDAAGKYVANSTFSSNVTQLSDRINAKVSQTDFNALGTRVGSAESKITQQSALISAKAEKTDLNALSTRVSSAEAKITSDAINLTVKSQITTAVDGVQVGGRNLLKGTKDFSGSSSIGWLTSDTYNGFSIIHGSYSGDMYADICVWYGAITPESNTEYTLSFWCKGTGGFVSYFYPSCAVSGYNSAGNSTTAGDGSIATTLTSDWKRVWIAWKTGTITEVKNVLVCRILNGNEAYVCGVKFEKGNKATDWTPAPEDVDASIALRPTTSEIKAGISITSGGISVFGQALSFAGKVTFSSLDSDSQGRITTAQSTASSAASAANTAQGTANTANSTANSALSSADTANSGLSTLKNSLGGLAYLSAVSLAKLDSTIVEGGYIKTSLIDADTIMTTSLLATKIAATDISTSKLTVNDGARIGDLYIYSGGLCTSPQGLILTATPFLYLNKNGLIVNSTNLQPSYSYINRTEVSAGQITIKCATTGTWNVTNPGLQIEVSGNSDNTAINILAGYISGLRLRTLTVRTSQTLSVSDGIIISEADSEITLTLPSNPGIGKMYFIRKNGGGRIWVNGSYIINDGDWYRERSTSVQLNRGCFAIFMYNGTYWTYNTFNG
nr:alanine-zipper protein [uncultured Bacteroides sp.]